MLFGLTQSTFSFSNVHAFLLSKKNSTIFPALTSYYASLCSHNTMKPSSRSWILMNTSGEGTILDVDKYEIMHRVQIHARDLRILDPNLSYPSTILCREKVIILNLEYIKALITAEEVLLRDPLDKNVIPVVEKLRRWLPLGNSNGEVQGHGKELVGQHNVETGEEESPFEFRALEVALETTCSSLAASTTKLESEAYLALDELTTKISSHNLDWVRKLKSKMTRLTGRVQKVRDELEQLLDDSEDMADLYLSRKLAAASSSPLSIATNHGEEEEDVEELEMLLEIDGTLNKLIALRGYIDDTEDYINIQLDNHRNQLIQLELFLSLGTVCLSIYSLVAGIFGMNIPYTWNDHHGHSSGRILKFILQLLLKSASFIGKRSVISYKRGMQRGHVIEESKLRGIYGLYLVQIKAAMEGKC
ncbi:hypothetical protein LguiB_025806 [Lonicera macranthoides]